MDTIRCDEEYLMRLAEVDSLTSTEEFDQNEAIQGVHALVPYGLSEDYYKGLIGGLGMAVSALIGLPDYSGLMPVRCMLTEWMRSAARRIVQGRLPR